MFCQRISQFTITYVLTSSTYVLTSFFPFWLLGLPIAFPLSSWLLTIHILQCLELVAIWSTVPLDSTMMAIVLCLLTSLSLRKRLSSCLGLSHNWLGILCQHHLIHHIWLLFRFYIFNKRSSCFFSLDKHHFL